MFDRVKSIIKSYIPRLQKAKNNAIAFVKRNKKGVLATAGVAAVVIARAVVRSLTNTVEEDDWVKDACDLVRKGDADFLIASHSETGASVLFAPANVIASTFTNRSGLNTEFDDFDIKFN